MCLLDISGGWINIVSSMILFAGEDTAKRVLFEAGLSESFSDTAIKKGILTCSDDGFKQALDIFSEAGFGDFTVREMALTAGYARITCRDTFEAWAFLNNNRPAALPVCHYASGVLLSFMKNFSKKSDLVSVETRCIARGDAGCEFFIGTETTLKKTGISQPDWGMSIKEKTTYLENLLDEKTKLHEKIKASETMYKTLVEDINDGYLLCRDGIVIYANDAFLNMHGYAIHDVLRMDAKKFLPKACQITKDTPDSRGKPGFTEPIEFSRVHRDGRHLPTELKINMVDFQGLPAMIGIFSDISKRKEMERRVLEHQQLASLGRLSATIAHEIKNPLSAIKTNIQILSKTLNLQGFDKRRLEIANGEIRRLDRILEDILDFSSPVKQHRLPSDIRQVINTCVELLNDKINEADIRVLKKMSRPVPPLAMNYEKIQQAILNLLLNAIDAMPNGGTLELITGGSMRLGKKAIRVEIKDSGRGIPPNHLERIFEPFFSRKPGGTGLGLSNVKKIIEAHGGRIAVMSRPGCGTRVRLLLPLAVNPVE